MNEQTHTAEETIPGEKIDEEIGANNNAKQITPEENGSSLRTQKSEQVDFAQMYDMLTERDKAIEDLKAEITELKKSNTDLLLKVNSSHSSDGSFKNPYESFIDSMVTR